MRSVFIRIKKKTTRHTHKPADQKIPAWMKSQQDKAHKGESNHVETYL